MRSNDVPGMTLTNFMPRSVLVPYAFVWEKGKTMFFFFFFFFFFSETVVVCHSLTLIQIIPIQYF